MSHRLPPEGKVLDSLDMRTYQVPAFHYGRKRYMGNLDLEFPFVSEHLCI